MKVRVQPRPQLSAVSDTGETVFRVSSGCTQALLKNHRLWETLKTRS
jgi:hypothetical protein